MPWLAGAQSSPPSEVAVDAAGRHRDGHLLRVGRVRQHGVDGLAAEAGAPLRAVRVVPQRADQREGLAAVVGAEQRRRARCRPTPRPASHGDGRELPDPLQLAPVSSGNRIAPSGPFSQVAPRSSERSTCGPQCQCLLAMNSRGRSRPRGAAVSTATAWTSLRSSSGPVQSQLPRRASLVAIQSPLRVPIITTLPAIRPLLASLSGSLTLERRPGRGQKSSVADKILRIGSVLPRSSRWRPARRPRSARAARRTSR